RGVPAHQPARLPVHRLPGQRVARGQEPGARPAHPGGHPFVVNVGARDGLSNRAVVGDAPRRNRAIAGLPFVLRPRVVNYSKAETAELTPSVFIDEKEVARTPLTIKPGETAVRKVNYTPTEPGVRRGRFEVTGKTPD